MFTIIFRSCDPIFCENTSKGQGHTGTKCIQLKCTITPYWVGRSTSLLGADMWTTPPTKGAQTGCHANNVNGYKLQNMHIQVGPKMDTQFYFWDNLGNSAPILTILSLLHAEIYGEELHVYTWFFNPPHLYCVTTVFFYIICNSNC